MLALLYKDLVISISTGIQAPVKVATMSPLKCSLKLELPASSSSYGILFTLFWFSAGANEERELP